MRYTYFIKPPAKKLPRDMVDAEWIRVNIPSKLQKSTVGNLKENIDPVINRDIKTNLTINELQHVINWLIDLKMMLTKEDELCNLRYLK